MKDIKDMTLEELEREQRAIEVRQAELNLQMRALQFQKYPAKVRAIMKRIGWGPEDAIIHRTTGSFTIKE